MSALLESCTKDVKKLRLDEVGDDYETLQAKVVSCSTQKKLNKHKNTITCRDRWTSVTLKRGGEEEDAGHVDEV